MNNEQWQNEKLVVYFASRGQLFLLMMSPNVRRSSRFSDLDRISLGVPMLPSAQFHFPLLGSLDSMDPIFA